MRRRAVAAALLGVVIGLGGCANPDAPISATKAPASAGSPGEPAPPPAPAPSGQATPAAQPTPRRAVERFAALYANWSYLTLQAQQRELAAASVGAARLQARQAAASARDEQLERERVWNRGQILAVAPDRARAGWWVLVSSEQTAGSGEYESLPPSLDVTLALPVRVRDGWAISEWLPQS